MTVTTSKDELLNKAKAYVDQREADGGDWQSAVNDLLSDPAYAPLFEGLTEEALDELCVEISLGAD